MTICKSGIPYLTHVWNPVVGCNRGCSYCWAERFYATRGQGLKCELCRKFIPHVHPERLKVPGGKPKVIGVGFMTDLFHPPCKGMTYAHAFGVWTRMIAALIAKHPEHVFVTVTKCPEGVPDLDGSTGLTTGWPENWYVGATCTTQAEVDERVPKLLRRGVKHPFLNLEPLCERVGLPTDGETFS